MFLLRSSWAENIQLNYSTKLGEAVAGRKNLYLGHGDWREEQTPFFASDGSNLIISKQQLTGCTSPEL
jgi:hypothetical protein